MTNYAGEKKKSSSPREKNSLSFIVAACVCVCVPETSDAGATTGGGAADAQHAEPQSGGAPAGRGHLRRERTPEPRGGHLAGDGQSKYGRSLRFDLPTSADLPDRFPARFPKGGVTTPTRRGHDPNGVPIAFQPGSQTMGHDPNGVPIAFQLGSQMLGHDPPKGGVATQMEYRSLSS